jgi:hypothetical protein
LPLEGPMGANTTDRQARLRPERADRHPSLPVSMWTSAVRMAKLVASEPRSPESPATAADGRCLSNADFEFRGGAQTARAVLSETGFRLEPKEDLRGYP